MVPNVSWHLAVATDYTDVARHGVREAVRLASLLDARLSVIAVDTQDEASAEPTEPGHRDGDAGSRLRSWAAPDLGDTPSEFFVKHGLPGIEISRFAEESHADIVVLVRKRRSKMSRVLSGDTVDSVVRRSVVPCLLVPPESVQLKGMVVALDGTERGMVVLRAAARIASATGMALEVLTVEPRRANEPEGLAARVPTGRSVLLQRAVHGILGAGGTPGIVRRRGDVVAEILEEMAGREGQVLVMGYHRGGPPGVIDAGSTARRVLAQARGAVLTVPL
jgi:nucleotide-binding universal stress UspA family protein